ncbi:MAG: 3-phosphoserine/phosphohydroxythreonine transaminase [Acidimicrobiia bacterium]|nr:3-phosphoserine/phosphohydroxythreonine transaminase [Acidimicrobiia bacterium]
MERVHNFCAGPCTLPVSVLDELAEELPNFNNSGMSLIEMSHRAADYDDIHMETLQLLRDLTRAPEDFSVQLLQGGASLQFAMAPLNLLTNDTEAGYIVSGAWGKKALADAAKIGKAYTAWSGADNGFTSMPTVDQLTIRSGSRFLHITSNETIGGIRIPEFYELDLPMVADMSSDYLSRPIPWDRFDLVYGGAQKNLGPAGMAVVFVRKSVFEGAPDSLPDYLSYATHDAGDSLVNTPPMFTIWATNKVLKWMKAHGGVEGMQQRAADRSARVYDVIDESGGYYRSPVERTSRSHMNIVFRLADEDKEGLFLEQAEANGLMNLPGHRSVGGIRASIYNALPDESVSALVDFMADFADRHG